MTASHSRKPSPPASDSSPASSAPRWQRRPDARPEEILKAAMQVFVEKGFAATRLETVAALAGVSKGTLYLYFETKEQLFREAVKAALVPAINDAEAMVTSHQGPALPLLRELLTRWARFLADPVLGGLSKLMIAEAGNFPDTARFYMHEVVLRTRALFLQLVKQAIANGEIRPLSPDMVVRSLTTAVLFASVWKHSLALYDTQPLDVEGYLQSHLDIVLHGLLP